MISSKLNEEMDFVRAHATVIVVKKLTEEYVNKAIKAYA